VTGGRFGHAIADGEGISLIVAVEGGQAGDLAVSADPAAKARVVDFATAGDLVAAGDFELAVRVRDEEELERALEELDPELFVLAGGLEEVLDLLAEVPAGKLAIAELPTTTSEEIEELERAGMDAVIVHDRELL
jgi:NAD(P)H-dependent flavin oxidoreductase YrpB (nitropropane dioxygenase family)